MWASLIENFEKKDLVSINYSRLNFLNAKQMNTESVEEFTDRLLSLRDELEAGGYELKDEDMILTIMSGICFHHDYSMFNSG